MKIYITTYMIQTMKNFHSNFFKEMIQMKNINTTSNKNNNINDKQNNKTNGVKKMKKINQKVLKEIVNRIPKAKKQNLKTLLIKKRLNWLKRIKLSALILLTFFLLNVNL